MIGLALLLVALAGPDEFVEIDYAKIDRTIRKEPEYVSDPMYGLFILDPAGKLRVWAVLDRSRATLPHHDVLYLDRNGNGDLTEKGERFVGKRSGNDDEGYVRIKAGDVSIHQGLEIYTFYGPKGNGVWFQIDWRGEETIYGGYGETGTVFGRSPAEAPVLRPTILGPLVFAFREARPAVLIPGRESRVFLVVGNEGSGKDTLCAVNEDYLEPGKDVIVATLIARDEKGKEIRTRNEITGHC